MENSREALSLESANSNSKTPRNSDREIDCTDIQGSSRESTIRNNLPVSQEAGQVLYWSV